MFSRPQALPHPFFVASVARYLLYDFLDMQLHLSPEAFLRPNIFLAEEVAKSALEMRP